MTKAGLLGPLNPPVSSSLGCRSNEMQCYVGNIGHSVGRKVSDPRMLVMLTMITTIAIHFLHHEIVPKVNKDLTEGGRPFLLCNQISRKSRPVSESSVEAAFRTINFPTDMSAVAC